MIAILGICAIANIVCWIIVLVKIFQSQQIAIGVIGILCGIVAFIYGWMKSDEWKIKNIMLIWTIAIVGQIIAEVMMMHARGAGF
jgi:tellurite resistance protein TehA-like permease